MKEKFLLATFLDLKPKVTLYFPKLCMLFFLVLQLWYQSKYLGFGKSGRKVSGHECFIKEIIYKNKSKGADTIISKMFQNSTNSIFNRSSDESLSSAEPWPTESLSIHSLGFCCFPMILLSCLHFSCYYYYTGTPPVPKVRSNGSLPFYFSWHCVQRR